MVWKSCPAWLVCYSFGQEEFGSLRPDIQNALRGIDPFPLRREWEKTVLVVEERKTSWRDYSTGKAWSGDGSVGVWVFLLFCREIMLNWVPMLEHTKEKGGKKAGVNSQLCLTSKNSSFDINGNIYFPQSIAETLCNLSLVEDPHSLLKPQLVPSAHQVWKANPTFQEKPHDLEAWKGFDPFSGLVPSVTEFYFDILFGSYLSVKFGRMPKSIKTLGRVEH